MDTKEKEWKEVIESFMKKFNINYDEAFFIKGLKSKDYSFNSKYIIEYDNNLYNSDLYFQETAYGYGGWEITANYVEGLKYLFSRVKDIMKVKDTPQKIYGTISKGDQYCWVIDSQGNPKTSSCPCYYPVDHIREHIKPYLSDEWRIKAQYIVNPKGMNKDIRVDE